jgi:hypothetical protein
MATVSTAAETSPVVLQDDTASTLRLPGLKTWVLAFLLLGLGWRLLRYLLQFPIWGDEAYMCLNFPGQTHLGLVDGLRYAVVAPILFLWGELTIFQWLGGSELAVRLLPAVVGLLAVPLFWRLSRQVLSPAGRTLAIGLLAVAYYPVRHACEVRPYSLDLVVSIGLMTVAFAWMQQPRRLGLLVLLCLSLPVVLGLSNPVVFVAGGVSVALLPTVWRQPPKAKLLWLAYNLVLAIAFLGYLQLNMRMQPSTSMEFLQTHWGHAFPPREPLALVKWLVVTHSSNMMAYPIGGKNGGSALTLLLFLGGVWHFARARQWNVLLLCLVPFGLTFIAGWLRRYPYGDSARFCQHLAPAICLLTAAGCVSAISSLCRTVRAQKLAFAVACGCLAAVGLAGIIRDVVHPFKTTGDQEGRQIVEAIATQAEPDCPIVLLTDWKGTQPEFIWYLHRNHPRVFWHTEADWNALAQGDRLMGVRFYHQQLPPQPAEASLPDAGRVWQIARRDVYSRPLDLRPVVMENIEVVSFRRR